MVQFISRSLPLILAALAMSACGSAEPHVSDDEDTAPLSALDKEKMDAPAPESPRAPAFAVAYPEHLPEVPARVALYKVVPEAPPASLEALEELFAVSGAAETLPHAGGLTHVRDGERHLYLYTHGGAAYHNVELIGSEGAMTPLSREWLLTDGSRRLEELNLLSRGPVKLVRGHIGVQETSDATGASAARVISGQSVTFMQTIDGLPTFGGGSDVQFVYGQGGAVASFSHNVRTLEPSGEVAIGAPERALDRYVQRLRRTGRWSLFKAFITGVSRIKIEGVKLGYYVADIATPVETVEPVYAIHGAAHGEDASGNPLTIPVFWIEPAAPGRGIPSLRVEPEQSE